MNVMITDISQDLDTTVQGVQIAITVFLLVMAALMIPGQQADRPLGPQALLHHRPLVYGIGALISAVSPDLGVLILGNSILEGVGTALADPSRLHPHDLLFSDLTSGPGPSA